MSAARSFAETRVMVMAAPNGARRSAKDHPALPTKPSEIADCAASLLDAGVSVLHLHVRDEDGAHTLDADHYRAALAAIRKRIGDDLILQVTTEAVGRYSAFEQMLLVRELKPEAVSLALRELCPDAAAESGAAEFFGWLQREEIWPQYILYSPEDVARFNALRARGVFGTDTPHCLLVLGRYSQQLQGEVGELDAMLAATDFAKLPWSVCCFGHHEHAAAMRALERGGHVRLGFENNLLLADGSVAGDNAALVRQFAEAASDSPRQLATANEVREWTAGKT
jgi:uncharacterized protein (DUF849 family)